MSDETRLNPYRNGRTRGEVKRTAVEWIRVQRRIKIFAVLRRERADAERAFTEITEELRAARGGEGRVAAFVATYPLRKRRFEFDVRFNAEMLRCAAAGRSASARRPEKHRRTRGHALACDGM